MTTAIEPKRPAVFTESKDSGFTLIELSIVLVIIGLIVGGILVGQNLIKAASLRVVISEFHQYQSAVNAFKDKYAFLPGDFPLATAAFGKDNTNCSSDTGTAMTPGTCNGNGNGQTGIASAASNTAEFAQFWKQLALAGMISGNFTGLAGSAGTQHCPIDSACPASKFNNAGWAAVSFNISTSNTTYYSMDYGNALVFGSPHPSGYTTRPALTPSEAFTIDSKLDDGLPASGMVIADYWNNLCAVNNSGTLSNVNFDASYRVTDTTVQCGLFFKKLF